GTLQPDQYSTRWNHWVFARSHSGRATVYLNGSLLLDDQNDSTDICGVMGQFRIGARLHPDRYGRLSGFKGRLDEIRLYNYELSPGEILDIHRSDLNKFSGQVGGWKFDEGTGGTTADTTASSNAGTLSNAIWTANGLIGNGLSFSGRNS